jgi:1-deoxy-D-xylulose-5-phosphate reductoisomerase
LRVRARPVAGGVWLRARYHPCVRRVLLLGSTGSIGRQALDVIDATADLAVCGLCCASDRETLERQVAGRRGVVTACAAGDGTVPFDDDAESLIQAAQPDIVLNAIVGAAGLRPTLTALRHGIPVALANKESLVVGGELVRDEMRHSSAPLIPVDSEHSALFQLIAGAGRHRLARGVLTASGGPFRGRTRDELADVTVADALAHPTWQMGPKITVDSATLMNKGLEVIEAHHLFDLDYDDIEVVVHPQSFVHAMVRLGDGSVLMHAGPPDMRVPIGYALRWPDAPPAAPETDLTGRELTFHAPDDETFRCLALARQAGRDGGTAPAVLNGANEVAVAAFLAGRIGFLDIAALVERALEAVPVAVADSLEAVEEADRAARAAVTDAVGAVA